MIKNYFNRKLLGKLKVWQQRLATYISMINFIMLFYLYIIESPLSIAWYTWLLIISIIIILIIAIDILLILPASQEYMWNKNPEWSAFQKQWKTVYPYIKKKIKEGTASSSQKSQGWMGNKYGANTEDERNG